MERDKRDKSTSSERPRTASVLVGSLQISTLVGIGLGAVVFGLARQLLSLIVGGGGRCITHHSRRLLLLFIRLTELLAIDVVTALSADSGGLSSSIVLGMWSVVAGWDGQHRGRR